MPLQDGNNQMKAALHEEIGKPLSVVNDVDLVGPKEGQVLIKTEYCGICHSDVSVMDSLDLTPMILGHEAAGIVEEIGDGVTSVNKGDYVLMTPIGPCGNCEMCILNRYTLCERGQSFVFGTLPDGSTPFSWNESPVYQGLGVGGFAEYTVLEERNVVRVEKGIPLETVCLIGCGVQTGVGSVLNTAKVTAGSTVLVMGLGGVGLSVVQGARIAKAEKIIASDPVKERRSKALKLGATNVIDPDNDDLINAVMELTLGKGVDYAFDAVGNSELIALGLTVSKTGGSTVIVGAPPPDEELKFPSSLHLMMSEKRLLGSLLGSCNAQKDIPLLVEYWQRDLLDLNNMISQTYSLDNINSGIDDLRNSIGIRSVIKIHET
ncbi:MAG TPA: alcohol dehydrogenase [Acidimicrobiaceae bacterium]|nr:Zn-dependent alcohol dehydrogenase [bacterium]HAQ05034.1 alcohol dehydrogenase [Acidimicrobiaceae bacterium]